MNQAQKNKAFIIEYVAAVSGKVKTPAILDHYMTDQVLKEHIIFFDGAFPKYGFIADEIIAEGNQIVIRARLVGKHEGDFSGIAPSYRSVDFPFVVGYTIENEKIVSHWLVADQMNLMEQLGIENAMSHS